MKAFRKSIMAFALLLMGNVASFAGTVLPLPGVNGPFLGDPTTNLFSIEQSLQNNTFSNFSSFTTLTVNAAQSTSTVLNLGFNLLTAAVGVTGTMELPTAKPATNVSVANNTGVVVVLYGNATNPFTAGGIDFVNNINTLGTGVPGTATGGFVVTNGYTVTCLVPQGGNWWCR